MEDKNEKENTRKLNAKKRAQDSLVVSLIGVTAVITFIGGYILSDGLNSKAMKIKGDSNETEEVDIDITRGRVPSSSVGNLGFDENKVVDRQNKNYDLVVDSYDYDENTSYLVMLTDNPNAAKVVKQDYSVQEFEEFYIYFANNILEIHAASIDEENDTFFFLLADGSVEYIPLKDAVLNNDFVSFGTLIDSDVVKFYDSEVCEGLCKNCTSTVLAQKIDGTIYDLRTLV